MQNDMRDRLVELIQNAVDGCASYWAELIADHLIANGVVLPPCKVGDKVYAFSYPRTDIIVIDEETVESLSFQVETDECYYDEDKFGKTVFLTKEEAEQKLKEMRVENG